MDSAEKPQPIDVMALLASLQGDADARCPQEHCIGCIAVERVDARDTEPVDG